MMMASYLNQEVVRLTLVRGCRMQGSRGVNQRKPRPVCWKLRDLNAVTEPTEGAAAFPAAGLGAGDRVRTGDLLLGKQTLSS